MTQKNFKIKPEDIAELVPPMGYCLATDKITIDGMKVGFMCREQPDEPDDSGWQFFSDTETEEYKDDPNNIEVYSVNTIANYDRAIIPYLDLPYGTMLERIEGGSEFRIVEG